MLTSLSSFAQKIRLPDSAFYTEYRELSEADCMANWGAFGGEISDILTESTYYEPDSDEFVTIGITDHGFGYRKSCYQNSDKIILSASFRAESGDAEKIRPKWMSVWRTEVKSSRLICPVRAAFSSVIQDTTSCLIEEAGLKGRAVGGACVSKEACGIYCKSRRRDGI